MHSLKKICIVGAGNIAWHLSHALANAGHQIVQVFSRTINHARELAEPLGAAWINHPEAITREAGIYLLCLKDDALAGFLTKVHFPDDAIVAHTAGSQSINLITPYTQNAGVFYPLQTFTKHIPLDLHETPFLIEGQTEMVSQQLVKMAALISEKVYIMNSEQRMALHVAAMFASNFTNHLWALTDRWLTAHHISPQVLAPLMTETLRKALNTSPKEAQTGPARRGDEETMQRHLDLLAHLPLESAIYKLLSKSIGDFYS